MDLLRFLISLPARMAHAVSHLLYVLGLMLQPLVGRVAWLRPSWMHSLAAEIRRRPLEIAGGTLAAVVVVFAGWFGWEWYLHRPHPPEPNLITFEFVGPEITDYEQADGSPGITIHPVDVKFSASTAPIELVGKAVTRGITLDPALKGSWNWVDDRTLRFTPAADWPIGAHVAVQFDPAQVFAPHVQVADDHAAFDIVPFKAAAGTAEFYQDPQNPTAKKTIMAVTFDYPVDAAEFEKRITLSLMGRDGKVAAPLKFTVMYDRSKLKAWIHSQPLDLPRDNTTVAMTLDSGVRSSRGGDGTPAPLTMSANVPGLYSLTVGDVSPTLVNNDKFEPEQVLVLTTSDTVRGSDLANLTQAWVLPKRKPGVKQKADEPPYDWNVTEVSDDVLRHSQALKLEVVPTENEFSDAQSFKYQADPGQHVFIRFAGGLKSFGGYLLGAPNSQTFEVPDYPKLLHFMANGSLLSLSGDKHVSVVSRNEPGMKLEIGRVLPDQLQHLVSFNEGTFANPSLSGGFSEDHIVERFEEAREFPKGKPGEAHYEGVDLGQYLSADKHGIFLLHLSPYDPAKAKKAANDDSSAADDSSGDDSSSDDDQSETSDTRLIVVTDLGLLAKRELDGSRDVYVQSIHTGQPVTGARVSILAVNGQSLYSETSGADGEVHFPTLKGLAHEKRPALYLVEKEGDLSFLPMKSEDRQLDYSRFDIGGEANATDEGELSAYLFSDRGIYRPGDQFHIGMIVRTASWAHSPAGVPLQAEIVDPRGVTVKRQPFQVDASGFAELAYAPAETAPTGTWTVNLYIVGKDDNETAIGSTTVSVKEFLPDTMKVDATLSAHEADGWVKPDGLKGIVDVHNLFGTPAANRRVEASLTLNPTFPAFRAWPDYQFFDLRHAKDGYTTKLQDGQTNDQGHAEFDLDLKKYADATYQLYFLAKAYEADGGRSVAAAAQTLVSSNDWLVGYKSVDSLDYVTRSSPRAVHLVAINPQAKAFELKGLKAQLIERRYVSVLTKQDSGVYKYDSKLKEIPISEQPLTIPAAGMDYMLPTDKPGNYALVIRRATDNIEINRVEYAVAGDANVTRSLDRNAELQLNLSKQDYAQGESVEIAIRAPYAGSGLITIERDKVYAHAWFHADTTSSVQHITVPKDFEGNGYINVQYIRDPSSDEVFMSPLSYGVVPFSVNLDARRNALTVDSPALVKPGDTVTFKLHAAQPTKVVLFAVDEGILQVARYKLGDPLKFFFRKKMLDVNTSQILDLILPEFEKMMAMAAPGGDADAAMARQLNPFKRKRDKPVAFWSGIVDVDGDKDFSYTVPDYFNGKLRVMAVAVSPDHIGTFEGSTTVRADFVLSPNVPLTLAPGDEAEISVGVANNLTGLAGKVVPVAVALNVGPQLQVLGPATKSLNLGEMREGVLSFRVKATDKLGSGNLSFTAGYGGKSAKQSIDLSVRPAAAYRTQVDGGRVEAGDQVDLAHLRSMYDAQATRDAATSSLPLVLAQGITSYLVNYQNYCSEQIISSAMPLLVVAKWPVVPVFAHALQPALSDKPISNDEALAKFLDTLHSRQNSEGGFGLWSATPESEPFVSAYAMNFLLETRDRGVTVPQDMLDNGNKYLKKMAADDSMNTLDDLRQRAYAVYLLTRQGNVTTNDLAAVQKRLEEVDPKEWKNDLAAAWLAASYKMLKQDDEADKLIAGPQKQLERKLSDKDFIYGYYYDPLTLDASVLYVLAKHFPDRAKALSPQVMENVAWPLGHDRYNTLSASMTILALDSYSKQTPGDLDKLAIEEVHADGSTKSIAALQANLLQAGSWGASASKLRFINHSPVATWYVASQGGYDNTAPTKAIKDGIEIVRDYTDAKGNALTQINVGDEIDVHVKIRATGDAGVGNVAIVDLLPGGFEPVIQPPPVVTSEQADSSSDAGNQSGDQAGDSEAKPEAWRSPIGLSSSTWAPEYADIREDRVVIYGEATPDVREFVYRIKATNAGKFIVPPAYGESMYDRTIQARSPGGATLTVTQKP